MRKFRARTKRHLAYAWGVNSMIRQCVVMAPEGKDGIAVTYTLQPEARWGDGVPVSTRDIVFSWQVGRHPQSGYGETEMFRSIYKIDVKDEKTGKVENWGFEMGSPNGLMRAGWTRNTMKIGDEVTVEGSLAKDGSHTGNARSVVLVSTGKRLFAASSQGTTP